MLTLSSHLSRLNVESKLVKVTSEPISQQQSTQVGYKRHKVIMDGWMLCRTGLLYGVGLESEQSERNLTCSWSADRVEVIWVFHN